LGGDFQNIGEASSNEQSSPNSLVFKKCIRSHCRSHSNPFNVGWIKGIIAALKRILRERKSVAILAQLFIPKRWMVYLSFIFCNNSSDSFARGIGVMGRVYREEFESSMGSIGEFGIDICESPAAIHGKSKASLLLSHRLLSLSNRFQQKIGKRNSFLIFYINFLKIFL
jgi:hypothetical protein